MPCVPHDVVRQTPYLRVIVGLSSDTTASKRDGLFHTGSFTPRLQYEWDSCYRARCILQHRVLVVDSWYLRSRGLSEHVLYATIL